MIYVRTMQKDLLAAMANVPLCVGHVGDGMRQRVHRA
jgi:hypothetical protein